MIIFKKGMVEMVKTKWLVVKRNMMTQKRTVWVISIIAASIGEANEEVYNCLLPDMRAGEMLERVELMRFLEEV